MKPEDRLDKTSNTEEPKKLTPDEIWARQQAAALKKKQQKIDKSCKGAIKKVFGIQMLWYTTVLVCLAAFVLLYYKLNPTFSSSSGDQNWWIVQNSKFTVGAGAAVFLLILSTARIISNVDRTRRWSGIKKYAKKLPSECDWMIRELYIFYSSRKCIHFWTTILVGASCLLCSMYTCVSLLIDYAVQKGGEPKHITFYKELLNNGSWGADKILFIGGLVGLLLVIIQYVMTKDANDKMLYVLEEKYGRDQLVNESVWFARVSKVNFRYKTAVFVIICLTGCLFYLLFKRLICTIFDKSFVI